MLACLEQERHARIPEQIHLRHAKLQRIKTENITYGIVEKRLLLLAQISAKGSSKPGLFTFY